jgi:hypothetical protein
MRQQRNPRISLTPEMIALFERGCRLLAEGKRDTDEFKEVDKKLNWSLLHRAGDLSVFDRDLDGRMPGYMKNLFDGQTWDDSVRLRRQFLQAIRK